MAATHTSGPSDGRQWATSPRPKGRENAKNTLCRNVVIYGYCRHEKDGCMYNHDPTKTNSANAALQAQADSLKKRFNVESPSFTPISLADSNGAALTAKSAFSPKAANAAPFTPKISKASLPTAPSLASHQNSEWATHEIPEFIPQTFDSSTLNDQNTASSLADPFNPYADTSGYSTLESTPPSQLNPYANDASTGGGSYYHPQNNFTQPLQHHLYAPMGPHRENLLGYQRTAHDFFISENLRQELQRKAEATLQVLPNSNLPANIEHYHSLVPLDTNNQKSATAFGYNSWVYKATSSKDGYTYVLRRLEGFRLTSEKSIRSVQAWKRISNGNVVAIHDCFTTRAFGDSSLVLVTDYHPLSKTLAEQHLPYSSAFHRARSPGGPIQEQILWSYIVQIASALKAIHNSGLAARLIVPSKIILTNKNRIRLNACAVLDVVQSNELRPLPHQQQDDMQQLGRMILALATQNPNVSSNSKSLESVTRSYSARLRDCITSLIEAPSDVDSFIGSIADHFAVQFDNSLHSEDVLYSDLSRELENARLVRLLAKLGFVNERPEYSEGHGLHQGSSQWSETGERYYLKLFRDYVFHHVSQDGRPVVDLGHVVSCLNKLDAGSDEKIGLITRDEQNVFVVSYKEVKRGLESAFQELVKMQRRA